MWRRRIGHLELYGRQSQQKQFEGRIDEPFPWVASLAVSGSIYVPEVGLFGEISAWL
jgi:hypothetical protein